MTWLAWRQFRTQAAFAAAGLAIAVVILALTGVHLRHVYDTSGIATCNRRGDCGTLDGDFLAHETLLQDLLGPILLALPLILGMFWAAPLLARELESGTYRLAWTQSITRIRWLTVKVLLVGLSSIAVTELFSLMVTWWFSPIDKVKMDLFSSVFDTRGIVAIGYAAFAFAVGFTAGALSRRTLPAMATTIVAFVATREIVRLELRPHYQTPLTLSSRATPVRHSGEVGVRIMPHNLNDWTLTNRLVTTRNGTPLHTILSYQPANRYWPFQAYETAIFLALALVLTAVCFWWVHHGSPRRLPMTSRPRRQAAQGGGGAPQADGTIGVVQPPGPMIGENIRDHE